jgi:(2Fe-2S) ferredoxin
MSHSDEIRSCHVCVNISCREWGSEALVEALRERLADTDVAVKTHICFGNCWKGPNIVLYPEGTWYSDVKLGDVDDIVEHIRGGAKVERLIQPVDPQLVELTLSLLDVGLGE